jgi:hypothetical protein
MGRKKLPSTIKKEKALISKKVTTTKSAKSPLSELHTQFEDIQINLSKGFDILPALKDEDSYGVHATAQIASAGS